MRLTNLVYRACRAEFRDHEGLNALSRSCRLLIRAAINRDLVGLGVQNVVPAVAFMGDGELGVVNRPWQCANDFCILQLFKLYLN